MISPTDWQYDRDLYNPDGYAGFVYCIEHIPSGKRYIGKKFLHRMSKRKIVGPSDWPRYWGSSKALLDDIRALGKENFRRTILMFCKTRGETNYFEVEFQFKNEVLRARLPDGSPAFYNSNIMGRFFCTPDEAKPRKPSKARLDYEADPRPCKQCGGLIPWEKRTRSTCSPECGEKAYRQHQAGIRAKPK